jgi:hypothetical protein
MARFMAATEHALELWRGNRFPVGTNASTASTSTAQVPSAARVGQPVRGLRSHVPHDEDRGRIAIGLGAMLGPYAPVTEGQPGLRQETRPARSSCWVSNRTGSKRCLKPQELPSSRLRRHQAHTARAKSYCEGALALTFLYCARLWWTGDCTPAASVCESKAGLPVGDLTPIAKSWPGEWYGKTNSLAIQSVGTERTVGGPLTGS